MGGAPNRATCSVSSYAAVGVSYNKKVDTLILKL